MCPLKSSPEFACGRIHEFIPPESLCGFRRKCAASQQDAPLYDKNLISKHTESRERLQTKSWFRLLVQILLTLEGEYTKRMCLVEKQGKIGEEEDNSAETVIFSYKKS
jgi:hypothetical protein